jgi:hypothetical protein
LPEDLVRPVMKQIQNEFVFHEYMQGLPQINRESPNKDKVDNCKVYFKGKKEVQLIWDSDKEIEDLKTTEFNDLITGNMLWSMGFSPFHQTSEKVSVIEETKEMSVCEVISDSLIPTQTQDISENDLDSSNTLYNEITENNSEELINESEIVENGVNGINSTLSKGLISNVPVDLTSTERSSISVVEEEFLWDRLQYLYQFPHVDSYILRKIGSHSKMIGTFRYPSKNFQFQPSDSTKMFFIDLEKIRDSDYITFKYQCCAALATRKQINLNNGTHRFDKVVYLSMCALGHPDYTHGRFVMLQVFMTLCATAKAEFLIGDSHNLGKPAQIISQEDLSASNYYCDPEYTYDQDLYESLLQLRLLEMKRRSLFYDRKKWRSIQTQQPHTLDNLDISEVTADMKKTVLQMEYIWYPLPGLVGESDMVVLPNLSDDERAEAILFNYVETEDNLKKNE